MAPAAAHLHARPQHDTLPGPLRSVLPCNRRLRRVGGSAADATARVAEVRQGAGDALCCGR